MVFTHIFRKLRKNWKALDRWSSVPRKRAKALKVLFPSLFLFGLLLMIPEYYQQQSAERVFDGIAIPDPNEDLDISLNFSTQAGLGAENQYYIKIPYLIRNLGYTRITDIVMKVSLHLEFETKDGEDEDKEIFSKKKNFGTVLPGERIKGKFHYNYTDSAFDGENIFYFMLNCKDPEDTEALMDIILTFSLEGHSGYQILYEDIDLTDDTETPQSSGSVETSTPYRSGIDLPNMIIFLAIVGATNIFFHFKRRSKNSNSTPGRNPNQNNKITRENVKKFLIKRKIFIISLVQLSAFTLIPIFLYFNSLYVQKTTIVEDVSTGDYTARFEMATWISAILLSVIYLLTLLPSLKPKAFQPYSIKRGLNSLTISVLGLFSLLIWMTYTSIIAYEIEGETSAIVIVDTSPSFLPFVILSVAYVVIKVIDLLILILYESEFIALRSEQKHESIQNFKNRVERAEKMPHDANQLNELIFIIIQELGEKATFTQIKKSFVKNHLPKTARTGERFNLNYMQSLVNQFYLSKDGSNIFYLDVEAEQFLEDLKLQREQVEREKLEKRFELVECESCQALNYNTDKRCYSCQEKL